MTEPPAACHGVLFRIPDHKLNVRGLAGYERLGSTKDLVIFLRWGMTVVQSRDDCAVGERKRPATVRLNSQVVAQDGSTSIAVTFFVTHKNQPPVAGYRGTHLHEDCPCILLPLSRCMPRT